MLSKTTTPTPAIFVRHILTSINCANGRLRFEWILPGCIKTFIWCLKTNGSNCWWFWLNYMNDRQSLEIHMDLWAYFNKRFSNESGYVVIHLKLHHSKCKWSFWFCSSFISFVRTTICIRKMPNINKIYIVAYIWHRNRYNTSKA